MMAVSAVGSIAGGFIGAQGAEVQAQAQADADQFKSQEYMYQAGVALFNQKTALQNADYTRFAGEVDAQEEGMKVRAQIGETKATQSASGLDVASGSTVAVRQSEQEVGDENVALIRSDAAKKAYGFEVQAYQFGQESTWDMTGSQYAMKAAGYAKEAGDINATASIIGGITSAGSKFAQMSMVT
jgi:hypothetical protein